MWIRPKYRLLRRIPAFNVFMERLMYRMYTLLCLVLLLVMLPASCQNDGDLVTLEIGSQGEPGIGKVTGLDVGSMYLVRMGRTWYPVTGTGDMGDKLTLLNYEELNIAIDDHRLKPLEPGIAEIVGFKKDAYVCVYKYTKPENDQYLVARDTVLLGSTQAITNQRNMVIDLSDPRLIAGKTITLVTGCMDPTETLFIFVTADLINAPQKIVVTSGSAPNVIGGAHWNYETGNMNGVSQATPFRLTVSSRIGETGYFTISGPPPSKIVKTTSRGTQDPDRQMP